MSSERCWPSDLATLVSFILVFFFQAEDGIRDIGVTGVRRVLFRSAASSLTSFLSRRMGVSPTSCEMSSATRRREASVILVRTLQGTEAAAERQLSAEERRF